jgi:hypothetical protein
MGDGDVATVTDLVGRTQRPPLPVSDEMTMTFSQRLSRDHLVLEFDEDEGSLRNVATL